MDADTKHRTLTKSELHLMNLLWDKGEATVNDLMELMPEPRPAYTTVLTVMRVLTKKGIVSRSFDNPSTFGLGSRDAITTFFNFLSIIKSTHGGVLP